MLISHVSNILCVVWYTNYKLPYQFHGIAIESERNWNSEMISRIFSLLLLLLFHIRFAIVHIFTRLYRRGSAPNMASSSRWSPVTENTSTFVIHAICIMYIVHYKTLAASRSNRLQRSRACVCVCWISSVAATMIRHISSHVIESKIHSCGHVRRSFWCN